eukprot:TRINITY_DN41134_c0_g1_i1.p1 TRINITY_DN41134_c0_g1~~TRINITY_DN41134_c0_g1_i1.p1  ORF type:complete len:213 (-),score=20.10 TRINITY_DN41134_c0_g1_i1:119-715(-)
MSTRDFREAAAHGVNVTNAGHQEYSLALWIFLLLPAATMNDLLSASEGNSYRCYLDIALMVAKLPMIALLCCQKEDGRAFLVRASARTASVCFCVACIVTEICFWTHLEVHQQKLQIGLLIFLPAHVFVFVVAMLGLQGVAQIPYFGVCLAGALAGRGSYRRRVNSAYCGQASLAKHSPFSDTASELSYITTSDSEEE